MAKINMTDYKIEQLRPKQGQKRTVYSDAGCRGLRLRVSNSGSKIWFTTYRINGTQNSINLGEFPMMNVAVARKARYDLKGQIKEGANPANERQIEKVKLATKAETFSQLAEQFIELHAKPNKRSWPEDLRMINTYLNPDLGDKAASDIEIEDIEAILDKLTQQEKRIQADRVRSCILKIYNWGIKRDRRVKDGGLRYNPASGTDKAAKKGEGIRDRYLSSDEIATFWTKIVNSGVREDIVDILHLTLLTGCRSEEASGAHAKEFSRETIDLEGEKIKVLLWSIPPERTKNERLHLLPLPPLAESIVMQRFNEHLFPAKTQKRHVVSDYTGKALRKAVVAMGMKPFRVHDLRRTASTQIAQLGFSKELISKILNHVDSDSTVTNIHYIQHTYMGEKYRALKALEDHILELYGNCPTARFHMNLPHFRFFVSS